MTLMTSVTVMGRTFQARVTKDEGVWWLSECLDLDTFSQGKTPEEALSNLQEASELYVEEFGWPKGSLD